MFMKNGKEPRRSGAAVSVIGADMAIRGDVETEAELRVDGRIEGDVCCASLDQGEGGTICGNIAADEARLAGLVDGKVIVRALVLEASARVTGDVVYESLSIAAGARVEGRVSPKDAAAPGGDTRRGTAAVAELFPQAAE